MSEKGIEDGYTTNDILMYCIRICRGRENKSWMVVQSQAYCKWEIQYSTALKKMSAQ